ncbi:MAG TPA: VWA domain-containing protein [Arenicellales bacterium]|jgi:Ca-activated chloride channel family protein|nr:VWA domain-containing protein [Arenicellales bacterium]
MIEFLWPWAAYFLPLPLLVYLILPKSEKQDAALHVPFYQSAYAYESANQSTTTRNLVRRILLVLTWLLLVLATARPQWVGDPVELPATGRDLMLAVDISGSMGTEDMELNNKQVTRLRVVKDVVGDFVERRKGDRLGLILFGSQAYLQTPLTFDRNTVRSLLTETPLGIAGGKTAIGDAIGLAVKRLHDRPVDSRILILLTDGQNNVGEVSPIQAAQIAAQEGVKIYTVGFGADELVVSGLLFNRTINPSTELDTETLTQIAKATGGIYQRARNSGELAAIYKELDRLEPIEQDLETYRPVKSLYYWPLGLALVVSFLIGLLYPQVRIGFSQLLKPAKQLNMEPSK